MTQVPMGVVGLIPAGLVAAAFEDAVTCLMALRSYQEGRGVKWDDATQRVV